MIQHGEIFLVLGNDEQVLGQEEEFLVLVSVLQGLFERCHLKTVLGVQLEVGGHVIDLRIISFEIILM